MAKKKIIIISIVVLIVLITGLFYFFHPHSYSLRETKTPTCTEDGYEIFCCWCGNEYRTEQKQTGHNYKSSVEEPTCTDTGKTVYTCELCGDMYEEPIEAIGHDYEESTKGPTCTESGERVFKCKNCGDTYTEPIEALGHDYKEGVCVRCGEPDPDTKAEEKAQKGNDTKAEKDSSLNAISTTPSTKAETSTVATTPSTGHPLNLDPEVDYGLPDWVKTEEDYAKYLGVEYVSEEDFNNYHPSQEFNEWFNTLNIE